MSEGFEQFSGLDLPAIDKRILAEWEEKSIFQKSIDQRADGKPFVFYEGPPSANGMPGIHHVMGRTIKDLFCRFKTMQGFKVNRKGGWDTHGLPIELAVEKKLGITKEDIGTKLSVEDYNLACREEVLKYKDVWDDLTVKMGYWVDLENPYITFENDYIETLWSLLKQLYDKDLLYKGYTIQPYSPAAGTGLSTHELNQPGCYKSVKDTTVTAQFKLVDADNEFLLAWTTTPWTLPSNTALALGSKISYAKVETYNPYTHKPVTLYLAKDRVSYYFKPELAELDFDAYESGAKQIPYRVLGEVKGADLVGRSYEQLLPYVQPEDGKAFEIISGDFVTTEDGTGIVHIAPSFGADDLRVAQQNGIGSLTLVDKTGKFVNEVSDFAGRYVKNYKDDDAYVSVDVDIAVKLKKENKAFKIEKYEHNYPHCWRTDKPILYYPLDSWFVKVTAVKDRLVALNKTINWKPKSTGEGRFGNWLENLLDWNLSRSRFWGTPLPIWRSEDGEEEKCIGSVAELRNEIEKAVAAGFMSAQIADDFDLHKPYVDTIYLVSDSGKKMIRESDLIDVWFDSGAMPYAQWHYPFENKEIFDQNFPADFIAEGVDQTRGWFYTLHAISVMLKDSVAFKNVVSNGLLLDKNGLKMSKRYGNALEPFETLEKYGTDATRWYMISNSQPWDNLKFDVDGLVEVRRKFFGTLYNTYSFFSLYANVDGFDNSAAQVPFAERPEIDKWVLSRLNSLIGDTTQSFADYEPTRATRGVMDFVEDLSNWYVRLCRKRFWNTIDIKDDSAEGKDKLAAYQTLYTCLEVLTQLMAPVAPFFADLLFNCLNKVSKMHDVESVHLSLFPKVDEALIDKSLETRMSLAQKITSLILSLRKKEKLKVRQPLAKILIPILNESQRSDIAAVEQLILNEVNVKEIEYLSDDSNVITKSIKPNFQKLGKKLGGKMKEVQTLLKAFTQDDIAAIESAGKTSLAVGDGSVEILLEDVLIESNDIPGWLVNSGDGITVALDVTLSEELIEEGMAREFVNKLQRLRKDNDFEVTDHISVQVLQNKPVTDKLVSSLDKFKDYICSETLTSKLEFVSTLSGDSAEMDVNGIDTKVLVSRV